MTASFRKPDHPIKKRTIEPEDVFEDITFKTAFENVIYQMWLYSVSALHFFVKKCHEWFPNIELIQIICFSASYSRISPSFTAGKQTRV
jgi:hypothetical protein